MKKIFTLFALMCTSLSLFSQSGGLNVPSYSIAPESVWKAQVLKFLSTDYKDNVAEVCGQVLATPPDDANGKKWYEPDYTLTSFDLESQPYCWDDSNNPLRVSNNGAWQELESTEFVENWAGKWAYGDASSHIPGDIYYRRTFTVTGQLDNVMLSCGYDEAPVEYYINGTLVMQAESGYNVGATMMLTDEQIKLIKTDGSDNILAVHVHNTGGDNYADCGLYNIAKVSPTPFNITGLWDCSYIIDSGSDLQYDPWYDTDYDETENGWTTGQGPFDNFAYGSYNGATQWTGSDTKNLYVRRHFTLTEEQANNVELAFLSISYDQDPKVYINGLQVFSASGWSSDRNTYTSKTITGVTFKNEENEQVPVTFKAGDNVLACFAGSGGGGQYLDFGLYLAFKSDTADGINVVEKNGKAATNSDKWYDIAGQQLNGKPTKKGIYINNGHKVVVK